MLLSEIAARKFKMFDSSKGNDIKVAGSLNPEKKVQDRVRVLDTNGVSQGLRATDYKDPVKILFGIDKSINDTKIIEYANCITAREDRGVSNRKSEGTAILEQVGQLYGTEKESNPQAGRVYSERGISPTLDSCSGGNRMPKILEDDIQIQIRKLTPRECWRLMGFSFEDCDKASEIGVANTHLYKQAGNGIITDCCKLLAEHLYKAQYDNSYVCTDEKMINFQKPQVD